MQNSRISHFQYGRLLDHASVNWASYGTPVPDCRSGLILSDFANWNMLLFLLLKVVFEARTPTISTRKSMVVTDENPATHRTTTLTPQTRTVHRTTRRTRKNTQRNTRQTNNNRKQTQNNRGTTQNQKMTELKVSGNYCTWSILARTLRPLRNRSGSNP